MHIEYRRDVLNAPIILFCLLIILTGTGVAQFNHPEIKWKTVHSDHFAVHFYDNTESFVSSAIAVAEEIYPNINGVYGFHTSRKIDLVLADYDDYANGFADWVGGGVMVWTPDLLFSLRGNTTWLRNVITHELTHIITMRKTSGTQLLDCAVGVGVSRPGLSVNAGRYFPVMRLFPQWFAEGLAQIGAYRTSNDCWDTRRDMVLRCAALGNTLLSLDQMGVFTHDALGREQVYNQGFSLTMHIEQQVGGEEIHRLLQRENGSSMDMTAGFEAPVASLIGKRAIDSWYREWRDSVVQAARKAVPQQPTVTETIWRRGKIQGLPRISADKRYRGWLTSNNDDYARTDLVVLEKGADRPVRTISFAEGSWDFSPSSDAVYFIKSRDPGRNGSYFKELFRCDIATGRVSRLSRGGRIYGLAASPAGDALAVVRFRDGRFALDRFDLKSGTFSAINDGAPGDPFLALDYHPADGSNLVVERLEQGRSSLYAVDLNNREIRRISSGLAREESPCWASDGRIYYCADYDGIYNIYSIQPDGNDLLRHTSIIGGAFDPQPDNESRILLFSEYSSAGFGIVQAPAGGEPYTIPGRPRCWYRPLEPFKGGVSAPSPYRLRMLRGYWESYIELNYDSDYQYDAWSVEAGMVRRQNDALNRFFLYSGVGITAEIATEKLLTSSHSSGWTQGGISGDVGMARLKKFVRYIDSTAQMPHTRVERLARHVQPAILAQPVLQKSNQQEAASEQALSLYPAFGLASNSLAPSLQTAFMLRTSGIFPVILTNQSDISLQTGRATAAGASFVSELILLKLLSRSMRHDDSSRAADDSIRISPAGAAFPLWFGLQDNGYLNEDVGYNGNGLSSARLQIAPSYMIALVDSGNVYDMSRSVRGISGMIDLFHGFQVTKYSGIPVSLLAGAYFYEFPVNSTRMEPFNLTGNSDCFLRLDAIATYNFPIARTIDAGRRFFFDALYGKIGYGFLSTANRSFLIDLGNNGSGFLKEALSAEDFHNGIDVQHLLIAGIQAGSVSEFLFNGGIQAAFAYDILSGGTGLTVAGQF
jgi:hypothetical protein